MILWLPLFFPLAAALLVLMFRSPRTALRAALAAGMVEVFLIGLCVWQLHKHGVLQQGRYLRADGLSLLFLLNLGLVFAAVLAYSVGYLRHIPEGRFSSPRWFYALLFLFLFTMMAAYLSANLGVLWIAIEATTLASALLVGFYNTKGAIEAGWKYLIVCTVGIAFALFGTIALYLAAVRAAVPEGSALDWTALMAAAPGLAAAEPLLKLAFVFVAVGYGTKIGFVPMHSWLPDAHAEAPAPISAMLSAALLNCAMYALLRLDAITSHAIGATFSHSLLLAFGSLSLIVSVLLMVVQRNLKRLLAYSSIEHMGIVALGVGLGGPLGLFGALLHAFNHSLAKTLLFFTTGKVRDTFDTLKIDRIRGMGRVLPYTSAALVLGGIAIVGLPPFGLFVSEFAILMSAFTGSRYLVGALMLAAFSVAFGALLYHFQRMLGGVPTSTRASSRLLASEIGAMCLCGLCLLVLGLYIPPAFNSVLHNAMAVLQ